ncbi:hypothetical protein K458DRAFT_432618 [Lentithecium fluviatile CBS 122367]|uniref:Uncharacterized protein n=1 Tax=Lentithecium fluviatile CBS 122367 TaxID=1168545 RepID=A0A6G1IXF0_9PLEO|nr:hypothetical protein K458DRAFT_432618 [Lentithecium fluviatile CBS 122367]
MSQLPKGKEPMSSVTSLGLVSEHVADIDVTEGLRTLVLEDGVGDPTPRPSSPVIIITPPSALPMVSQRPRQLSDQVIHITPRPRLWRKAATAPPRALQLYSGIKPQPPRRAISARTARPLHTSLSRYRWTPMMSPPLPRLSLFGAPASRSLISRRKSSRQSAGKMGLKLKNNVWRMSPQPSKKLQLLSEALDARTTSFSEKARVKETLTTKKMEALQTKFVDFKMKDLSGTPNSMMVTPRELYGRSGGDGEVTPVQSVNRGSLLSVSPGARRFSLPLMPNAQRHDTVYRRSAIPEAILSNKTVYIPGPIQLEDKIVVTPRRRSIATMELFDPGNEPKANRYSDMVAMDGVVMFFEDLGVVAASTEKCLDRYWVPEKRTGRQATTPRKTAPPVPPRPPLLRVSSASSGFLSPTKKVLRREERPPPSPGTPGTPGRRKGRLRQLLKSSRSIL